MNEEKYIATTAGIVRLKIVHVETADSEASLTDEEVAVFPFLRDALAQSREKSSTKTYPREFEALNPVPVILTVSAEEAKKLSELVKRKTGFSLYDKAVKISFKGDVYIIAVEHHCG